MYKSEQTEKAVPILPKCNEDVSLCVVKSSSCWSGYVPIRVAKCNYTAHYHD